MALTADLEYQTKNPTSIYEILAGAADTLYKGAIVSVGTDGYIKVAADVADELPLGMCKEQVVAAGSHAEEVEIEMGRFRMAKKSQHQTTVLCTDDSGNSNANYNSKYFLIYNGSTKYYVWFDVNSGGTDPEVSGGTGIEVDIGTTDDDEAVAAALQAAIDAEDDFTATVSTATVTIVAATRGYTMPSANGDLGAVITLTNALYSGAVQSDIGELFYAIADDGVVYSTEKSNANHALGMCIGIDGNDWLWIDTRIKAFN